MELKTLKKLTEEMCKTFSELNRMAEHILYQLKVLQNLVPDIDIKELILNLEEQGFLK